jgi:O-Antigen ligase
VAWRLRGNELMVAAALAVATTLLAFAGIHKLGTPGLLLPLGVVLLAAMLRRPIVVLGFVVGLTILAEGVDFGLFNFTAQLYSHATVMNILVAMVVLSVALDMLRHKRKLHVPRVLVLPLVLLALAMVSGIVTGHAAGIGITGALHSENLLDYLLFLPLAVANMDVELSEVSTLLRLAYALAVLKAILGLVEIALGYGPPIEGTGALTYYEPTANWLILVAVLGIFTAAVARLRPPLWALLGSPLIFASLLLSYRRSFWIAAVLGLLLVVMLALKPAGRRILIPVGLALVAAVWLLSSVQLDNQSPIIARAASLSPTKIANNIEDRYRLDERANVVAQIEKHPITGLGIDVEWQATHRTLPIEHEGGRGYVHFAALWYWLKLGILGLFAYLGMLIAGGILGWRIWRGAHDPTIRAFGLASLCALAGLAVMETTASFTGVDTRFTVLIAAQLGLLALLERIAVQMKDPPASSDAALGQPAGGL